MIEKWKNVFGYEGLYQVSDAGRVKSLTVKGSNRHHTKDIILKQTYDLDGYLQLGLHKDGKRCCAKVHRIVAVAFLKNKPSNLTVNHKDGVKTNNSVTNLEWCTNKENIHHAIKIGLIDNMGEKNGRARAVVQYAKDGKFIKKWGTAKQASLELNINNSHIGECCKGERKKAGGFVWKYA